LVPDAPVSLTNVPEITDESKIKFTWVDGASDGGTSVIDYKLFYAKQGEAFTELAVGVLTQSYTTSVTLDSGDNYEFKVQSRNSVGYSLDSETIVIRAARIPDAPISLANDPTTTTDQIISFTWSDGAFDGGSPVIDYAIYYD
jgi:hypothetical protein